VKVSEIVFTAQLYEFNLDNIYELSGLPEYASTAGTLQTVTGEAKGTGWVIGQAIRITYRNSNK
jgi:hypothetical protein